MNNIFLFFLFLNSFFSFSQNLSIGKYCTPAIAESDIICIDILKNNYFKFEHSGCLGIQSYGTGKYEINNWKLTLHFDNTQTKKVNKIHIQNTIEKNKDSIVLIFILKDIRNNPIEGVNIFTKTSFQNRKGWMTDKKGTCTIQKLKNNQTEKYEISFLGYEPLAIDLSSNSNKTISIILFEIQPKLISNITKIFYLENITSEINTATIYRFKKVKQ